MKADAVCLCNLDMPSRGVKRRFDVTGCRNISNYFPVTNNTIMPADISVTTNTHLQLPIEIWLTLFEYMNAEDTINVCLAIELPLPYSKNKCFTFCNSHDQQALYQKFSCGEFNNCKINKLGLRSCDVLPRDISNLVTFSHLKELHMYSVEFVSPMIFEMFAALQLGVLDLVYCVFHNTTEHNSFNLPITFKHLKALRVIRCTDYNLPDRILSRIRANLDRITIYESMGYKFFSRPLQLTAKHFVINRYVRFPQTFTSNATELTIGDTDGFSPLDFFPCVETVHLNYFQFGVILATRVKKIFILSIRSLDDIYIHELRSLDQFEADFIFDGFEYPMLGDLLEVNISLFNRLEYFLLYTRKKKSQKKTIQINFGLASLPSGDLQIQRNRRQDEVGDISENVLYGIETLILNAVHTCALIKLFHAPHRSELGLFKLCKKFATIRRLIISTRCSAKISNVCIDVLLRSKAIRGLFPCINYMCIKRKNKKDQSHVYL